MGPLWGFPDFLGFSRFVRGFSRLVFFSLSAHYFDQKHLRGTVPKGSLTQSGPFPKKCQFGNPPVCLLPTPVKVLMEMLTKAYTKATHKCPRKLHVSVLNHPQSPHESANGNFHSALENVQETVSSSFTWSVFICSVPRQALPAPVVRLQAQREILYIYVCM